MPIIEILKCQGCGANLPPGCSKCEYCSGLNIIIAKEDPFTLDSSLSKLCLNYFRSRVTESPYDGAAAFSLGLLYLKLKVYDFAIKNFERAIYLLPEESEVYYYYAISLMKGRKPKVVSYSEIKKIEEYLNSALQLNDSKVSYYIFLALIKYDFYLKNGMNSSGPFLQELIKEIRLREDFVNESEKVKEFVPVTDFAF
jgi:tetratricopeptide (TPR) repeat protein